jgi:arylsulfatase A
MSKVFKIASFTLLNIFILFGCGRQGDRKPNIIMFLADDLGYGELGCYGQKIIRTPNIDHIAADGMRFTQHYSGSPVCAPSRCVLLTGKHTGHAYIRDNGNPKDRSYDPDKGIFPGQHPIPESVITISELLKKKGYATATIGKWGLGFEGSSGDPNKQGFDLFYGYLCPFFMEEWPKRDLSGQYT